MTLLLKFLVIPGLVSVAMYFAIALGLILSQRPAPLPPADGLNFESTGAPVLNQEVVRETVTAADGSALGYDRFSAGASAPLVVVIHGSGWNGSGYLELAQAIAANGAYEVLVPDLRGHKGTPGTKRRGDVDYVGQLEDDLAALITAHASEDRRVILVGHSSGGGLAIRLVGGAHGHLVDRAVLIAPFLHYAAPTARSDTGGWAFPLTRRLIGLSMLNNVGITALNHLDIMQFNFPTQILEGPSGDTATTAYSYRLNTSFAPRNDYLSDIKKLPKFLLIAGAEDEAFLAREYEPTLSAVTNKGTYILLPDADHIGILRDPRAFDAIVAFLSTPD